MTKQFDIIVCDPPYSFSDKLQYSHVRRGAEANYPTMTIYDIQQLDIKSLCSPTGTVLCLWVPSSLLREGLDTMKAWGFKHKQTYVWVKTKKDPLHDVRSAFMSLWKYGQQTLGKLNDKKIQRYNKSLTTVVNSFDRVSGLLNNILAFGMGRLFRQTHEICLIGTSNNGIYKKLKNKSQRSVSFGENLRHSAKPEHLQDSLEVMFPDSKKIEIFARRSRPGWTCLGNEIDGKDIRDALTELK